MLTHHSTTLKSGLPIIKIPMPSVDSVTVMVMANTGSRYEKPKEEGIAHFFEHMVFKGTANYPDSQTLAVAIDAIGADFNAFTSKEYTGYYVKSASRHFKKALDVVSDMILTPTLPNVELEREKGVIIEELNMYHDTPTRYIAYLFERMFFEGSGLSHDIVGNKTSIMGLARRDFAKFLKHWYGLGNLVLVIAGNQELVESKETVALIKEAFGKEAGVRVNGRVDVSQYETKGGPISPYRLHVEHRETEQAHLVMGWPSLKRGHEDRFALSLLSTVLGGNMSSRLFTEVREKRGLCYYVRSDVDYFHDAGVFGASAGVDPKRINEAIKVIRGEFEELAAGGTRSVTAEELEKAKEYLIGSMILSFEDSRSVAQFYGLKHILTGKIESPAEVFEQMRAVTLADLQRLAKDLVVKGDLRLAVIGPYKGKSKFEDLVA